MPRAPLYQLRINLDQTNPAIWRRVLVSSRASLRQLHDVIQAAMGWADCQPYRFQQDGRELGPMDRVNDLWLENDADFRVRSVLCKRGDTLAYEYDFIDSWRHTILLEEIVAPVDAFAAPRCLDGALACPPEDCGGVHGYMTLVAVLRDAFHPAHRMMLEWAGADFDPAVFDLSAANRQLVALSSSAPLHRPASLPPTYRA